ACTPCRVRQENYATLVTGISPQNFPAVARAEVVCIAFAARYEILKATRKSTVSASHALQQMNRPAVPTPVPTPTRMRPSVQREGVFYGAKKRKGEKRNRLTLGQKREILQLLDQKVSRTEIMRRFNCGRSTVGDIRKDKATLQENAASTSWSETSKSRKGGDFPKVDSLVMTMIEDARKDGTFADDANPSDDELELVGTENVESEGGRRLAPPPPFSELSSFFGPLEKYAESCGISGAAYHLRKAKMDFIQAMSSKPAVQADIRTMFFGVMIGTA
ncbi:unnamed protein product, partial [Pylaiella littoralis]